MCCYFKYLMHVIRQCARKKCSVICLAVLRKSKKKKLLEVKESIGI